MKAPLRLPKSSAPSSSVYVPVVSSSAYKHRHYGADWMMTKLTQELAEPLRIGAAEAVKVAG
jgi:hypothetical protein